MLNFQFLVIAISLMVFVIVLALIRKYTKFDMNSIDVTKLLLIKKAPQKPFETIVKNTGDKSLVMVDAGTNKVTVLATLRQITGLGLEDARHVVDNPQTTFMSNISNDEADMTKKALEFVGAKIDIV